VKVLQGVPAPHEGLVFKIGAAALAAAFVRARTRAGLPDLHFHDLRHTAATRMAALLPNLIELAAVTGHQTVQMLKRYYHPDAQALARKLG
jgi:integrase